MPMQYPFRLQLQVNLCALLATITPANGYVSDFSAISAGNPRVIRGRIEFGNTDPLPMLAMFQPPVPPDMVKSPLGATTSSFMWPLIIQGTFKDDPDNPTDPAEIGLADVRKCLAIHRAEKTGRLSQVLDLGTKSPLTKDTGNAVLDIDIGPGVVRPPDDISAYAYFWQFTTFDIVENLKRPYG